MSKSVPILIYLFPLFLLFNFCDGFSFKRHTPKEFLNHTVRRKEDYSKDSIEIIRKLSLSLKRHESFFHNKAYFDSTTLVIDSIVYSPDFTKLAVFIMTKNPTSRQLVPDSKYDWYYDANCYLGLRKNDTISLYSIGPRFSNFIDRGDLSRLMRETYFTKYAEVKDAKGEYKYKYNIDDVRFWSCPIWDEMAERDVKRKAFEEEKVQHPENIYEPKQQ